MSFAPPNTPLSPIPEFEPDYSQQPQFEKSVRFEELDLPQTGFSHFRSVFVSGLDAYSFENFISTKEKALIYFYNTNKRTDLSLEPQFVEVSSLSFIFFLIILTLQLEFCVVYALTSQ